MAADLLCAERMTDRLAEADPVIFQDPRVLENLLEAETQYIPRCDYFQDVQPFIRPFMRKVVATWMMEVCEEEMCEDQVFSTAVNLLDRFLCECQIPRTQLQMYACVCLLIASKVRQCHALSVARLAYFTENSVTPEDIRNSEVLVLLRLGWDLTTVTGYDYVDHVLERLSWDSGRGLVRSHARTLVHLCYTEPELIRKSPALIASGCLLSAARGLKVAGADAAPLCELTHCHPQDVEAAARFVEAMMVAAQEASPERALPAASAAPKVEPAPAPLDHCQPETPTDVQEIFF